MDTGNNGQLIPMNTEAIAEVKVLTPRYQAEFGRSSGLQITAATKSGTNHFHGSVYDIERNSDWNANSWANQKNGDPKPLNEEKDWGYLLGGPIGSPAAPTSCSSLTATRTGCGSPVAASVARSACRPNWSGSGDFSQSLDNQRGRCSI